MIRISLVIPTRDRPGPLAACLGALAASFPQDAEAIVVSDGGSQDLGPVIAPFVDSLRLRLIQAEHGGPAAARNRGLQTARGEIVAFTDDDCLPRPGWLAALATGVDLSPPRAVGGSTRNGLPENAYADAAQLVLFLLAGHDRAVTGRERFLPSNNFAFPTGALIRLGGFDERFRTAEDRDLCRRWADAGFALGLVPAAVVEHDERMDMKSFVSKFCAYGRGAAKFHSSGAVPSLRESMPFHLHLPVLLVPELRRRGLARGAAIVALLTLWEIANLTGFLAEKARLTSPSTALRGRESRYEGALMPRVSVVIPTRDRRGPLARALASVEAQTFRDFEIIVVDDGSVDGTVPWLRANHPPVSLVEVYQPGGAAAARNRGVERARGEIIAFLDDDDVWRPSYLETQVAQLNAHPEADLCTAAHVEVDAAGCVSQPDLRPLYHYPVPLVHFLAECPIHTLSLVACRRAVFERIGQFDESLSIVHDLDWYLRLIASGGKVEHTSSALVEHAVPGGLVTRHRQWFLEEQSIHRRFFPKGRLAREHQRLIRAARTLLFARVGLAKGDLPFGLARLIEAFLVSPIDAAGIIARAIRRRKSANTWGVATGETR